MEEDVGFYKKVKAALAKKDNDQTDSSDSSAQSSQTMTPDSPMGGIKSVISNGTLQTGSIMTNSSNEYESMTGNDSPNSSLGKFLVRPRSAEYCD